VLSVFFTNRPPLRGRLEPSRFVPPLCRVPNWNGAGMHGTARLTGGSGHWEREREKVQKVVQLIYVICLVYVCLCQVTVKW